jgi:perosamine synthetase
MYQKRFQIYPRLQLDISYDDLTNSLLSFGHSIDINQSLNSIQSFFQSINKFWKYLLLKTLSIPWIYYLLLQTLKILSKDLDATINATTRGFSQGNLLAKIRYRPPHHLVYFLAYRLRKCEENKCQDFCDRIETAQHFLTILPASIKNIIFPGIQANYHSFWLFPIIVTQPEILMMKLRDRNFDVTRGTTSLTVSESSANSSNYPSLENAKYLMEHVLFLPISSKVPTTELERLVSILSKEID